MKRVLLLVIYFTIFIVVTFSLFLVDLNFISLFVGYLFYSMATLIKCSILSFCFRYKSFKIKYLNIDVNLFSLVYLISTIILMYLNLNVYVLSSIEIVLFVICLSIILLNKRTSFIIKKYYDSNIKEYLFLLFINEEDAVAKSELSKVIDKIEENYNNNKEVIELENKIKNKIIEYNTCKDKLYVIKEIDLLLTIRNSILARA